MSSVSGASGGAMRSSFASVPTSSAAPLAFSAPMPAPPMPSPPTAPSLSPPALVDPFAAAGATPLPQASPSLGLTPSYMDPYGVTPPPYLPPPGYGLDLMSPSSLSSYATPQIPPPPAGPFSLPSASMSGSALPGSLTTPMSRGWSTTKRIVVTLLVIGLLVVVYFWFVRKSGGGGEAPGGGAKAQPPATPPLPPLPFEATLHIDTKTPLEIKTIGGEGPPQASVDALKTQLKSVLDALAELQAGQQAIEDSLGISIAKPVKEPPSTDKKVAPGTGRGGGSQKGAPPPPAFEDAYQSSRLQKSRHAESAHAYGSGGGRGMSYSNW